MEPSSFKNFGQLLHVNTRMGREGTSAVPQQVGALLACAAHLAHPARAVAAQARARSRARSRAAALRRLAPRVALTATRLLNILNYILSLNKTKNSKLLGLVATCV